MCSWNKVRIRTPFFSPCSPRSFVVVFTLSETNVHLESGSSFPRVPGSVCALLSFHDGTREQPDTVPRAQCCASRAHEVPDNINGDKRASGCFVSHFDPNRRVSEQRLFAEAHRQSFAAVQRMHQCDRNLTLLCVFRSRDVAFFLFREREGL